MVVANRLAVAPLDHWRPESWHTTLAFPRFCTARGKGVSRPQRSPCGAPAVYVSIRADDASVALGHCEYHPPKCDSDYRVFAVAKAEEAQRLLAASLELDRVAPMPGEYCRGSDSEVALFWAGNDLQREIDFLLDALAE